MNFIPEGDVYRLIVRSKLPTAEKFERWVFDEVLPQIRQTGGYGAAVMDKAMLNLLEGMTSTLATLTETVTVLGGRLDKLEEKPTLAKPLRRRRAMLCAIERLDESLQHEVDSLLFGEGRSYREVAEYLAEQGVFVSKQAVCNYYQKRIAYLV